MQIALAPNAFRGSLTAPQAVECLGAGLRALRFTHQPQLLSTR